MSMRSLKDLLRLGPSAEEEEPPEVPPTLEQSVMPDQQRDKLERDIIILEDEYEEKEKRVQREAEKQAQVAAEDSLKDLHVIRMGVCPKCGEHLNEHLFATICEACGWNTFEVPHRSPVRIHLRDTAVPLEGERCYILPAGDIIVIRNDVVIAKITKAAVSWIEYLWTEEEITQRYKQVVNRLKLTCGWCNGPADPHQDGFSLVQIAFGTNQERYVFCSKECYEAFRQMYPSRVHRNCYETKCAECDLCVKRYDDEDDSMRMLAKDFLKLKVLKK